MIVRLQCIIFETVCVYLYRGMKREPLFVERSSTSRRSEEVFEW